MKHIEAIVRAHKLDELKDAMAELGMPGMTVTEVKGFGHGNGQRDTHVYRGSSYVVDFIPKLKVEIVAPEGLVAQIVDIILTATRTGRIGDGKVFISDVRTCVRIRTGERDKAAL
jgi:nitrogen regulatory protein P-II 1